MDVTHTTTMSKEFVMLAWCPLLISLVATQYYVLLALVLAALVHVGSGGGRSATSPLPAAPPSLGVEHVALLAWTPLMLSLTYVGINLPQSLSWL
jgi:hypothetical protein